MGEGGSSMRERANEVNDRRARNERAVIGMDVGKKIGGRRGKYL